MAKKRLVKRAEDLAKVAQAIERAGVVGLDIETTAKQPHHGDIRLVQFNTDPDIYVIDLFETKTLGPVVDAMRASKAITIVQHAKFEQRWFLDKYNLELEPLFDTYRASALIHNGHGLGHNLYDLYNRELGKAPPTADLGGSDWSGPLTKEQYAYAASDVEDLPILRLKMKPQLARKGLNKVALIEFRVVLPEASMENNGFRLDKDMWEELARANKVKSLAMSDALLRELPHPKDQLALPGMAGTWNLNSPKQLLEALRKCGLEIDGTSEKVLAMQAGKYPIAKKVIDWRHAHQLVKSFGEKHLRHIDPTTGRIHAEYFPFTGAGRYACSKPNLQQIPRGKAFRDCFQAGPGRQLVIADYSQIELRLAAEISGDQTLLGVYRKGEDAHRTTAALVNGIRPEDVTKLQRQMAKPVNFGLIYGMGWKSLIVYAQQAYGVSMTEGQAKKFHQRYFEGYSGIARWHDHVFNHDKRRGIVRTLSGRLRYLDPERHHNEFANCLDGKTEALTARGWVTGFDLKKSDYLLTKDQETGELEWQQVTDLKFFPDYEGEVWEFKSRSFNAVTTPAHRWLVYNKSTRRDEERTTETLSQWGDHRIHRTGTYLGSRDPEFTDDFVELAGWFLTDGSWSMTGTNKTRSTVNLYQSEGANPHKVELIDRLVEENDWLTGRYYYPEKSEKVTWRLEEPISTMLHDWFPDRVLTPMFINKINGRQARLLVETMLLGDGHTEPESGKQTFCSGVEQGASMFQALCVLAGYATSLKKRDMSKYKPRSEKLKNIPKGGDVWYVTILKRDKAQVRQKHVNVIHRREPVWCPVVPNTWFVARREGQVYITGNTPVQGSGADGLKASMWYVYHRLKKYGGQVKMVHMVHDELVLDGPDEMEMLEAAKTDLEEGMKEGMLPFVTKMPVVVEGSIGPSWADK